MLAVQLFEQPLYKLHLDLVTKPKVYMLENSAHMGMMLHLVSLTGWAPVAACALLTS